MAKNLTLSLDPDLLKTTRKVAIEHDTSVNQMVRDFLGHVAREKDPQKATAAALREFFGKNSVTIGKQTWTRADLHERR